MTPFADRLAGVFAASLTPLKPDFSVDLEAIPVYLSFLARRGCQGALILGTTGEGPSFSFSERKKIYQTALFVRQEHPHFRLLAGTGTPSLEETISLNQLAFNLGYDGVVSLPPYYFRNASEEGLFAWFSAVIQRSVPEEMPFFLYHIPSLTGIKISLDFLSRLKETYPRQFAGLKDSSGEIEFCRQLGVRFGKELMVFTGNDRLFSECLENHGNGCITAMANLYSPLLSQIWEAYQQNLSAIQLQHQVGALRAVLERYAPFSPILKSLIHHLYAFPNWAVRPPLIPVAPELARKALQELGEICLKQAI